MHQPVKNRAAAFTWTLSKWRRVRVSTSVSAVGVIGVQCFVAC